MEEKLLNNLILILLFLSNTLVSQVNTEKYRTPKDFEGFTGYLEISGTLQTGNTERKLASLDSRFDWKTTGSLTFLVLKTEHEYISGNLLSNNVLMHLRNVVSLTENLKSELFTQINYDKKILVDRRELLGGGLRYKFLDFETSDFALGTSYMFEHEIYDLSKEAIHSNEEFVSRWSNYISLYLKINSTLNFGGVMYFQPMFTDFSDNRILSENSLTVSVSKILSFSLNFRIRHDSKPPDGIEETDTRTRFGVGLRF